ncbi:MAG: hypothetical protein HLUCCA11_20755 [Phormidesmis priestleyi Ana]|uniref:Uncharacterized protein n=1 Tax=Phormidesmis priestleyi Ana TaxID=1666911 RepID=A0A0N8KM44_9CYAN|nr:MAG: hypothetical protein HLUCCA11_20755 [Phormidesmis priestleyi Ana]
MTYTTEGVNVRPDANNATRFAPPVAEYHDTVRWGPIFAGIVVSIVSQLLLSALGAVVGGFAAGEASARTIGTSLGIWAVISLLISLFLGGLTMASSCGPMNSKTSMLNGTIMWATTLVISGWLLATGVSGTFGIAASAAGNALAGAPGAVEQVQEPGGATLPSQEQVAEAIPNVTGEQADLYAANASKAGLSFLVGTLLGLVAALVGSATGAKKPRAVTR